MDGFALVLLVAAGVVGGAANAIAGGGTFFTLPALITVGLDPLTANASNALAIYPGQAAAVPAYREELRRSRADRPRRCLIAAGGGLLGALLLLWAGTRMFASLVPWLLLGATVIFAAGPLPARSRQAASRLVAGLRQIDRVRRRRLRRLFRRRPRRPNDARPYPCRRQGPADREWTENLLAAIITTISVVTFVSAGVIAWPQTLVVLAGAGGYFGGRAARYVPARLLRLAVVATGLGLSIFYFMN